MAYWNNIPNSNFNYQIEFNKGKDLVKTLNELKGSLDEDTLNSLIKDVNEIYIDIHNLTLNYSE